MEYKCTVQAKDGRKFNRVMAAENPADVVNRFRAEGLLPLRIHKMKSSNGKAKKAFLLSPRRVKSKELAVFTRQLGVTLTSGLLLTEALEAIAEDLENQYFRGIISKIRYDVQSGTDLSSALSKYPKIFSFTYRAIVRVGEATGRLYKTLMDLAKYLEDTERLKEKVKGAIRYPLFVMGFAGLVMVILVFFLIPQFAEMYEEFHAELPLLTRVVIGISRFSVRNSFWFIAAIIGLCFAYGYFIRFPKFRYTVDYIKLKIPIIGKNIIHKALVSRYCRTLGFLLSAGVALKESLDITAQVSSHMLMSRAIDRVNERVVGGGSISEEMRKQKIFPGLATKMTAVGERTGRLSDMLERTAQYYEDELESTLAALTTLLEPVLIIFVGVNVLVVVLALYLPIFYLSKAIR
ncbi:MAG: type II secretion system F family protein [Candidatus Omnitrophica bacterium]|nr:type II secretion system F family protein [Candidatus Omnitrophota bacterium]